MFQVTPLATARMKEFFKGKEISPIRIYYHCGGWGPPSFAMALDKPNDFDEIFEVDGFVYVVNKQTLAEAQPIRVDVKTVGFYITGSSAACFANANRSKIST
jgi:Fe-S cluster assembly iron-binding protein IscA